MNNSRMTYQTGLTLVEMMVALLISTVLLAGVVQIFSSSKASHKITDSLGFMQESGRMATQLISSDLRRAGFWGGNKDLGQLAGGSVVPVTPAAATYLTCNTGDNTWALMFTQRVFGINDDRGSYDCIPSTGATKYVAGDVLTIRYVNAQNSTTTEMATGSTLLYIRSSLTRGKIFLGANQGDAGNAINDPAPVNVYPLVANAYYVGTSSVSCNSASVPALFQVVLGANGQPTVREIVAGIEDMQVQYGWDTDGDGIANRYVNATTINTASYTYWNYAGLAATNTIVSVRVWLLVRAACAEAAYTNEATYSYAEKTGTAAVHLQDHYRRQVYNFTVALRN